MVSSTGKKVVKKLQCRVCSKFEKRLCSKRNYSSRWVTGATSFKVSGIKADQHLCAVSYFKKEHEFAQGLSTLSDTPIVKALHNLFSEEKARLDKKFDIAYVVATEKLAFTKYPKICKMEAILCQVPAST